MKPATVRAEKQRRAWAERRAAGAPADPAVDAREEREILVAEAWMSRRRWGQPDADGRQACLVCAGTGVDRRPSKDGARRIANPCLGCEGEGERKVE